jgi:hypothetical protein
MLEMVFGWSPNARRLSFWLFTAWLVALPFVGYFVVEWIAGSWIAALALGFLLCRSMYLDLDKSFEKTKKGVGGVFFGRKNDSD